MQTPDQGKHLTTRTLFLTSAAIGVAVFLLFAGAAKNGFVSWDDDVYVTDNPRVQHPSLENVVWFFRHAYFRSYTPLTFASHMLDVALWGEDPAAHHAHNVVLHALNAVMMFWLALLLIGRVRARNTAAAEEPQGIRADIPALVGASIGAIAFGIHPLRVESAAWVSDRKDLLAAFFLLPTIMTYLVASAQKTARSRRLWLAVSSILMLFSMLAKSIASIAPAILLLLDILLLSPGDSRRRFRTILATKIPYIAMAFVVAAAAFAAIPDQGTSRLVHDLSAAQKFLLPLYSITFYLAKLVWPFRLAAVYDVPPVTQMLAYGALALLLTALAVLLYRMKSPSLLLAWLAYILLIGPTIFFLSSGIQPLADRYTYLATAPLFLAAAGGIARLWSGPAVIRNDRIRRSAIAGLSALVLVVWAAATWNQIRVWQDSVTLWSHAIRISPNVPAGYNSLGVALGKMGRGKEAIAFFNEALKLDGEYSVAWNNLGIVHRETGNLGAAVFAFRKAAMFNPNSPDPFVSLGEIAESTDRPDSALAFYRTARAKFPESPQPYARLAMLFSRFGDLDSASRALETIVRMRPDDPRGYVELARVYEMAGENAKAAEAFARAAALGDTTATSELGRRSESQNR